MNDDVIILGANGRVGAATVDLALADGFTVTAVVRTAAKVTRPHPRRTVVQGDTTDLGSLRHALLQAVGTGRQRRGSDSDGEDRVDPRTRPCVVMPVGADPLKSSTLVGDTVANL